MSAAGGIGAALLAAYRRTRYRVYGDAGRFTLRVGRHSPALAALYTRSGCRCAAFVTAWNPASRPRPYAINRRALRRMRDELCALGLEPLPGLGENRADAQGGEPSLLVPGLRLAQACSLGRRYGQNALLWAAQDAKPRLVVLRRGGREGRGGARYTSPFSCSSSLR